MKHITDVRETKKKEKIKERDKRRKKLLNVGKETTNINISYNESINDEKNSMKST